MATEEWERMDAPGGGTATRRPTPRWILALVGFGGLTVLFIVALEVVLRLAGVGYRTSFFIPAPDSPSGTLRENPSFFWRFMGRRMARTPMPVQFSREKPDNTVRILILGESAALGDPEPAYGFGRFLEVLLAGRYPSRSFEIINTATTAIDSRIFREIAADAKNIDADFWLVYAGNNEYVGPSGGTHVIGGGIAANEFGLWLRIFRIAQMMEALFASLGDDSPTPGESWGGMSMFADARIPLDGPSRRRIAANFRKNLDEVLRMGLSSGAGVLVSAPVVNLGHCGPMASLGRGEGESWQQMIEACTDRNWASLRGLASDGLLEIPDSADYHFFLGRALLESGRADQALMHLQKACDMDLLPFRATSDIRRVVSDLAGRDGVSLVDPTGELSQLSGEFLPGAAVLFEHVHFKPLGNYGLALAFARQLAATPSFNALAGPASGEWASMEDCSAALALTEFDRYSMTRDMLSRIQEQPLAARPCVRDEEVACMDWEDFTSMAAWRLHDRDRFLQVLAESAQTCVAALESRPGDWIIHQRYAIILDELGDTGNALDHLKQSLTVVPHSPVLHYQSGILLSRDGRNDEARTAFNRALSLRPSFAEARLQLAWLDWNQGKREAGLAGFEEAISLDPLLEAPRVARMVALKELGRRDAYLETLQQMARSYPSSEAVQQELTAAVNDKSMHEAVDDMLASVSPDDSSTPPAIRMALGRLHRRDGKLDIATQFFSALISDPAYATQAHYQLGLTLVELDRIQQSVEHFVAVLARDPDFWPAKFNLGVALAKLGYYDTAWDAFSEIPPDDGNYRSAREYMRKLEPYRRNRGEGTSP